MMIYVIHFSFLALNHCILFLLWETDLNILILSLQGCFTTVYGLYVVSRLGHWAALRSDSSAEEQGPSHSHSVWTSRARGRQSGSSAVWWAEEGRARKQCRHRLELRSGCSGQEEGGGVMTRTGGKEEGGVCGDVRRRKKSSKPDKASE